MGFSYPASVVTGDLYAASQHNTDVVQNILALAPSGSILSLTGTQTAVATPASITNPYLIYTAGADLVIQGLVPQYDGQRLSIVNWGGGNIYIEEYSASAAAMPYRILTGVYSSTVGYIVLTAARGRVTLVFEGLLNVWRVLHHDQGAAIGYTPTFAWDTGTMSLAGTPAGWFNYYLRGSLVRLSFDFSFNVTGIAGLANNIQFSMPNGYLAVGFEFGPVWRAGRGFSILESQANNAIICWNEVTASANFDGGDQRYAGNFELLIQ